MDKNTKEKLQSAINHIKQASEDLTTVVQESPALNQSVRKMLESDEDDFGAFLMTILALNTIADDLSGIPGLKNR